jgi:ribonuclease HII
MSTDYKYKVGIDEVGTGAWAGPAYVCGICAPEDWSIEGLRDSKKLDKPKIYRFDEILSTLDHKIEVISVEDLDFRGMIPSLLRAYRRISKFFQEKYRDVRIEIDGVRVPSGIKNCVSIKGGDNTIPHIMAAAILAKARRDKYMIEMAEKYPGYQWETNVGYGTSDHFEGMNHRGLTPLHRVSFKPVRQFLHNAPDLVGANRVSRDLYTAWKRNDPNFIEE